MLVVIDPGHGGSDPGAVYNGRQEKDDVLNLGKAVGNLLEARGVDVVYTREGDIYETPFKKAQDGNSVGADYFVSIHRNSSEYPNQYSGAEVLVYSDSGERAQLADNILEGMEQAGLKNLGVKERKDLVVLRRTQMPAVLVEAGFINNDTDNATFDRNFDELAEGIADGILKTLGYPTYGATQVSRDDIPQIPEPVMPQEGMTQSGMTQNGMAQNGMTQNGMVQGGMTQSGMTQSGMTQGGLSQNGRNGYEPPYPMDGNYNGTPSQWEDYGQRGVERYYDESAENFEELAGRSCNCQCPDVLYRVQVGAYRNRENADRMLNSLLVEEFPAFIVYDDGLYKVQVGAYRNLTNAITMEHRLRQYRYNTYISTR